MAVLRGAVMGEHGQGDGRMIELGGLRIHLRADDDPVTVLQSLVRHLSNQEVADILGVSERTVRRWKRQGRLPDRGQARLKLADLLLALAPAGGGPAADGEPG